MPESEITVVFTVHLYGAEDIAAYKEWLDLSLPVPVQEGDKMYRTTDIGYLAKRLPENVQVLVQKLFDQWQNLNKSENT